jgi:hypothetical protein
MESAEERIRREEIIHHMSFSIPVREAIALIEADRAATEAKVREEYAGVVEALKQIVALPSPLTTKEETAYRLANNALAAIEGKVSQG